MIGGGALPLIWWADDAHDTAVARTMGLATFSFSNIFFSFTVKDELRSIFDLETFADRRLLLASGVSVIAILFGTELQLFQRILGTVSLTGSEWAACLLVGASILVVSEIRKLLLRRAQPAEAAEPAAPPAPTAA